MLRTHKKKFISWQTRDLLRITWYGYKEFCNDLIQRHLEYSVYPLQLTGSAVQTIFSCLKLITGGHLSVAKSATARANLLTRYEAHE